MNGFPAMSQLTHILTDMPLIMQTLEAFSTVKMVFNANPQPNPQVQCRIDGWSKLFNLESIDSYHTHDLMAWGERK